MRKTKFLIPLFVGLALLLPCSIGWSELVDFNALGNGQKVTGNEASALVNISASGPNLGATAFDTDPAGLNAGGPDTDLLVDQGNILILQCSCSPGDSGGSDFFDVPDDSPDGGTLTFSFTNPVELTSIDIVDIDTAGADVILTDGSGLTRSYNIPLEWTGDAMFATLDLTSTAAQAGTGTGDDVTASEDAGFDPTNVVSMDVQFDGSGGVNNLLIVPEPTSLALLFFMLTFAYQRRR